MKKGLVTLIVVAVVVLGGFIWIKNIYNRFMKRRYENMEAFRASK